MIVIDTSALLAIFFDETKRKEFSNLIDAFEERFISAVSWVELSIVVRHRLGNEAESRITQKLMALPLEIVPVDVAQANLARHAFAVYGKGRHPAGLNFGDCFAYALARQRNLPLLYQGNDFARTDIEFPVV